MSKKKEVPIIDDADLWDEFWHAGAAGGSCVSDCVKHGITFFDANGEFMEEGELEKLQAKAAANPEKYVALDGGTHMTEMLGHIWHWDCKECRAEAHKYMEFIWGHRRAISRFINARLATEEKEAIRDREQHTIKEEK